VLQVVAEPRLRLLVPRLVYFLKYFNLVLTFMCFVHRMVRMYQIARYRMAWHPPIRVHSIPNSSLSELESESKFKWGADISKAKDPRDPTSARFARTRGRSVGGKDPCE
jgi:hypothetical protein